MAAHSQTVDSGPVREPARITSLDLVRGVAVLGILLMNAVSFRFGHAPYFNLSAGGSETWLDWVVGIFGEVFIDQKFMGLFSLLFGAGMILFIDRASRRGRRALLLNLWRNTLLLIMGVFHFLLWDRRCADGLCNIVGLPDRPAKASGLGAHLPRYSRVHAVRCHSAAHAEHRRHDQCIPVRSLDTWRVFGPGDHRAPLPARLFSCAHWA